MKKKLALAFLLGFLFHKGLNFFSDYRFDAAFMGPKCHDIMLNGGNLSDRFRCTDAQNPGHEVIDYMLIRPTMEFGQVKWVF